MERSDLHRVAALLTNYSGSIVSRDLHVAKFVGVRKSDVSVPKAGTDVGASFGLREPRADFLRLNLKFNGSSGFKNLAEKLYFYPGLAAKPDYLKNKNPIFIFK